MPDSLNRPFVVLGGGGHGAVVVDMLQTLGCEILGVADPLLNDGTSVLGVSAIGSNEDIMAMDANTVYLAMGLGSVGPTHVRSKLFDTFASAGFSFPPLVHPSAYVARSCVLGDGAQVMAGAVVQARAVIGKNVIINTRVSVDHDCNIGDHVHIAPGATLSGGVRVGDGTHIGTGSNIIQAITVGAVSVVGAGVTVLADVPDNTIIRASETPIWCKM